MNCLFDFERRRMSVIVKGWAGLVSMVWEPWKKYLAVSRASKAWMNYSTDQVQEVLAEVAHEQDTGVSYKSNLKGRYLWSNGWNGYGWQAILLFGPTKLSAPISIPLLNTALLLNPYGWQWKSDPSCLWKVGLDGPHLLGAWYWQSFWPRVSPGSWDHYRLCKNCLGSKAHYPSTQSRATRSAIWEMVSTMLHPWRWQMWSFGDTAVDIAQKNRMLSRFWIRTWWYMKKESSRKDAKSMPNMTKYIKMTVSSNFGNIFSLLLASIFFPFPSIGLSISSFWTWFYDLSCIALAFRPGG